MAFINPVRGYAVGGRLENVRWTADVDEECWWTTLVVDRREGFCRRETGMSGRAGSSRAIRGRSLNV